MPVQDWRWQQRKVWRHGSCDWWVVHYSKLILKLGADIVEQREKLCILSDMLPLTIAYTESSEKNTMPFIVNTKYQVNSL